MYAEAQQLVHDDGGQIVLMFNNYVGALSTKIGHGEFNTDFDHDGGLHVRALVDGVTAVC